MFNACLSVGESFANAFSASSKIEIRLRPFVFVAKPNDVVSFRMVGMKV